MESKYSLPGFFDPMSSISHLAGAVIFLVLAILLVASAWNDRKRFWYTLVFAVCSVMLLSLSSVYHMFQVGGTARAVMLRLDVAAIFFLIAGTATPIHGILFRGWRRWSMLIVLWAFAIGGATLRTIYFEQIPRSTGLVIFLVMGWLGAITAYLLWERYGWNALLPTLGGGLCYTVGGIMNVVSWPTLVPKIWGPHETFHLFVLAGLGWHWGFIAKVADGRVRHDGDPFLNQSPVSEAFAG